jgi:predicted dehydrogenase
MSNTSTQNIRVGVIGLGKIGVMHACLLKILPNVTVAALCDKSHLMRIVAKRTFHNCKIADDICELADLNLDAVYVLTPIPSHYYIIKEIYSQRIANNIFVEKTLAANLLQSEELVRLAQEHKGVNAVGYMKRFSVTFNQAKKLLEEQAIGSIVSFKGYAYSSDFADAPEGSTTSKTRGGVLEDLGSHVADLAIWFFGDLAVTSAKIRSEVTVDSEDSASLNVKAIDEIQGNFEVSWCKAGYRMPEFGLSVRGTKGSLKVSDDEVKIELDNGEEKEWHRQNLKDNVGFMLGGPEYFREDEDFVKRVLSKVNPESDFGSANRVDRLIAEVRSKAHSE